MIDVAARGGHVVVQAGEARSARVESLRALAALAVLVSHVFLYSEVFAPTAFDSFPDRLVAGGGFGVQLFFALTGYLIYRPFARRDLGRGGPISIGTYFRNRAVRILPLYWVAVAVLLTFTENGGTWHQWWRFALFAQSFSETTAQTVNGPMWSLVVELHFYLLLPLLAWGLAKVARGRRAVAIWALLALAVPSVVFRRVDPDPFVIWRFSLPATFYGFVPGMVLAILQLEWERRPPSRLRGIVRSADAWLVASAGLWALCCWDYGWADPLTAAAAFLTVGAVVLPLTPGPLVRLLDLRWLALLGVASYSLYIWHVPIIEQLYTRPALDSFVPLLVVAVPLALLAALVSYVVVERPTLAWRRRWAPASPAPSAPSPLPRGRRDRVRAVAQEHGWLLALCGVAFLTRARMVMATRDLVLSGDPFDYDRLGRLLAAGQGFGESVLSPSGGATAFRPPLYPLFLGGVYEVTDGSMLAARLLQAGLGAVTVALLWLVVRRLFDRRVAYAAAAVAAVYPPLVVSSAALMSEAIFLPLLLGAVWAVLKARDDPDAASLWAIAAGTLVGLGLLARPNSLALVPAFVLLLAGWRKAALLGLTALLVLLPWQLRNASAVDGFVFIADIDGFNVAGVYNEDSADAGYPARYQFRPPNGVPSLAPLFDDPTLDEVSLGAELRSRGFDHVRDNPTAPFQAVAWNSFRMLELSGPEQSEAVMEEAGFGRTTALAGLVSFWALLAAAVAAVATGAIRRVPRALWLAPGLLWLGTALFLGNARLRAPIEPFLILAAAPLVATAGARVASAVRQRLDVAPPRVAT